MTNTAGLITSTRILGPRPAREPRPCSRRQGRGESSDRSRSGTVGRLLWALIGILTAALTVGLGLYPILGPGALDRSLTSRLSPAVFAAGLAAYHCFSKAARRTPPMNIGATTCRREVR